MKKLLYPDSADGSLDADLLIIGGSLTGLTMALACQQQGISFVLLEKHARSSVYPRAKTLNARAMEVFRALGVEQDIRAVGAALEQGAGRISGPTLLQALAQSESASQAQALALALTQRHQAARPAAPPSPFGQDRLTPSPMARAPQNRVDPLLKQLIEKRGGTLRFSAEALALEQHVDAVTTSLLDRETCQRHMLRTRYVVAADGAGGKIREWLGIEQEDFGIAGRYINILFEADLRDLLTGREFTVGVLERPGLSALIHAQDGATRWTLQLATSADHDATGDDGAAAQPLQATGQPTPYLSMQRSAHLAGLVRDAIGVPGLPITILNAVPWQAASAVARAFRHGRVFLAGDCAHQMTPFMANGASSGIQDALNLAWKLALVLRGNAGDALLDTYQAERLPVTRKAVLASSTAANANGMPTFDPAAPDLDRWVLAGLDFSYQSDAVIGGGAWEPLDEGQPGRRVPHAWLRTGDGTRRSTLDLADGGFALLTGSDNAHWHASPATQAIIPVLRICAVDDEDEDKDRGWLARAGIGPSGALLVRPDGFIAWRAPVADPAGLAAALRRVLGSPDRQVPPPHV